MSRQWIWLAVAVVLLGALHLPWWDDTEIEPALADRLATPAPLPPGVNAFHALVGFGAAPGSDPARVGADEVRRINAVLADPAFDAQRGDSAHLAPAEITFKDPEGVLCSPAEPGCLPRILARGDEIRGLAAGNTVLLERLRALWPYPRLQNELMSRYESPIVPLSAVLAAHRLLLAAALVESRVDSMAARHAVGEDLRFVRRALEQADWVVGKIAFATMFAEAVHVLGWLPPGGTDDPGRDALLAPLSDRAHSLVPAFDRELRASAHLIDGLVDSSELRRDLGVPEWLGPNAIRPLYKPGRSLRLAARCWAQARARSSRPADQLAALADAAEPYCEPGLRDWLLNPIGAILISVARPDPVAYALRLHALDGLLALARLREALRRAGVSVDEMPAFLAARGGEWPDPFTGRPARLAADAASLQFDRPAGPARWNRIDLRAR